MKSYICKSFEKKILKLVDNKTLEVAKAMMDDQEILAFQDYANTVSITRLNYNDHGPVHMRKVSHNAMIMASLLKKAGILLCLEKEKLADFDDARVAIFMAAFLHDIGMGIGRDAHERSSTMLAMPIIKRTLEQIYPDSLKLRCTLQALAMEGILGHMATQRIHSLEAGIILVADGCDMEKGRARIPMMITQDSKVGDIHKYSSSAISGVKIEEGTEKPIRIIINMNDTVGFFQVEEVLFPKISKSPIMPYIEVYAGVEGQDMKCYLH